MLENNEGYDKQGVNDVSGNRIIDRSCSYIGASRERTETITIKIIDMKRNKIRQYKATQYIAVERGTQENDPLTVASISKAKKKNKTSHTVLV